MRMVKTRMHADEKEADRKDMAGLAIASGGRYDNLAKLIGGKKPRTRSGRRNRS